MKRGELAKKIQKDEALLKTVEEGEDDADWGTIRAIAETLALSLPTLMSLAEELAPGPGGEEWRQQSDEAKGRQGD